MTSVFYQSDTELIMLVMGVLIALHLLALVALQPFLKMRQNVITGVILGLQISQSLYFLVQSGTPRALLFILIMLSVLAAGACGLLYLHRTAVLTGLLYLHRAATCCRKKGSSETPTATAGQAGDTRIEPLDETDALSWAEKYFEGDDRTSQSETNTRQQGALTTRTVRTVLPGAAADYQGVDYDAHGADSIFAREEAARKHHERLHKHRFQKEQAALKQHRMLGGFARK